MESTANHKIAKSIRNKLLRLFLLFVVIVTLLSFVAFLYFDLPGSIYSGSLPAIDEELGQYIDSVQHHLEVITVNIGERHFAEPEKLNQTAEYLESVFRSFGYNVRREYYTASPAPNSRSSQFFNVIADHPKNQPNTEIILFGAHYDSYANPGCQGADDNGTGLASLLILAKELAPLTIKKSLRLVAFVNEEPPFFASDGMGSYINAQNSLKQGDKIAAMFALDSLGYYSDQPNSQEYPHPFFNWFYPNKGNFILFVSDSQSAKLLEESIGLFRSLEKFPAAGALLPFELTGKDWSDHRSFWDIKVPAIMITDTVPYRNPNYHSKKDTIDTLHIEYLSRVTRGIVKMAIKLLQ